MHYQFLFCEKDTFQNTDFSHLKCQLDRQKVDTACLERFSKFQLMRAIRVCVLSQLFYKVLCTTTFIFTLYSVHKKIKCTVHTDLPGIIVLSSIQFSFNCREIHRMSHYFKVILKNSKHVSSYTVKFGK